MSTNWREKADAANESREKIEREARILVEQVASSLHLEAFLEAVRDSQPEFQIPAWMQAKNELGVTTREPDNHCLAAKVYRLEKKYASHVTGSQIFIAIQISAMFREGNIHLERLVKLTQDFLNDPLSAVQTLYQQYPGIDIDIEMQSVFTAFITIKLPEASLGLLQLLEDLFLKRIY